MASWGQFFDKQFIVIGICCALLFGLVWPDPGKEVKGWSDSMKSSCSFALPQLAVVFIFVLSGLGLKSPSDLNRPKPLLLGVFVVLFITPLLAYPILTYGKGYVNTMLLQGMALFCAVPTTLSSGVAMVRSANGNEPLALMLTTVTNVGGVLTMPWTCSWIFQSTVEIDAMHMLVALLMQTLVPLVFGLLLRACVKPAATFADKYKGPMTKTQNCCIFFVVWLSVSGAHDKIFSPTMKKTDLLWSIMLAILVHIVYRTVAYAVATGANLPPREWVCIVLMCSQKSLPVCVSVLATLPQELQANAGVYIVPCIMAHFSQLVIDGMLAVRWKLDDNLKASLLP